VDILSTSLRSNAMELHRGQAQHIVTLRIVYGQCTPAVYCSLSPPSTFRFAARLDAATLLPAPGHHVPRDPDSRTAGKPHGSLHVGAMQQARRSGGL
jgi:hypothetical protein